MGEPTAPASARPSGHEVHVDDFKSKTGDSLDKSREGCLVGQFGAEGGRARPLSDVAVVELCAQRSVCLAVEGDLICVLPHLGLCLEVDGGH